jgi:beta-lactamase superfamily II metal-dependent hydrolase
VRKALLKLVNVRAQHPLMVDVLKLSHHGSRANLMTELLNVVQAKSYIVSTDNSRFQHPDDEALARTPADPVLQLRNKTQPALGGRGSPV